MPQVTRVVGDDMRSIRDDGGEDIFGGLFAKVVLFFDADGRLLASHCEVDRLRGWIATLREQPFTALPEPLQALLDAARSDGQPVKTRDLPIQLPDASSPERFQASAVPVFRQAGKLAVSGVTVAIYDLAPVPGLNQHLGQLAHLATIGTLSGALAHEIKNALVAINTFVDLASQNKGGFELAPIAAREVRRINSLVAQLLRASTPTDTSLQPVHVHQLIEHALTITEHRTAGSRIVVRRNLAAESDVVPGDSGRLEQAFVNLLFNAVEAMGSHGTLTVSSTLAPRQDHPPILRIVIGDTGVGIPENILHRLFEPFFTTKTTGHGLGLVITRRIILDHGGQIRVESQPGSGTVFTVDLPSAARQP